MRRLIGRVWRDGDILQLILNVLGALGLILLHAGKLIWLLGWRNILSI